MAACSWPFLLTAGRLQDVAAAAEDYEEYDGKATGSPYHWPRDSAIKDISIFNGKCRSNIFSACAVG